MPHKTRAEILDAVDEEYEQIIEACFGLWSNSLWVAPRSLSGFDDLKDAYFCLIEKLLKDGVIRFIDPDEVDNVMVVRDHPPPPKTIQDTSTHWHVATEQIVSYLRSRWPLNATDENDPSVNLYFYEIPPIIWRGENNVWVGS